MSKEARAWAARQRVADHTITAVLRALAWGADKGTGQCRMAQSALANEAGLTERSVRASLVVLENLEIISRHYRSKGKYGRTTDLTLLALDRNFDVSKAVVRAIRKSLRAHLLAEQYSGSSQPCYRNRIPLLPEPRSGEYNPGDPVPYQIRENSYVEGYSTTPSAAAHDRGTLPANLIPLAMRGAA